MRDVDGVVGDVEGAPQTKRASDSVNVEPI